jgi:hypothetical protein
VVTTKSQLECAETNMTNCVFPLMTNLLNKGLREPDYDLMYTDYVWDINDGLGGEEYEVTFDPFEVELLIDDDCQVTGTHILWGNWSLRERYYSILAMNRLRNANQLS